MSTPDRTPDENRILAMVFEHAAKAFEADNYCPEAATRFRHYAQRFQTEPEPRFYVEDSSYNYYVVDRRCPDNTFQCVSRDSATRLVVLLSNLHDAAKGGKTE